MGKVSLSSMNAAPHPAKVPVASRLSRAASYVYLRLVRYALKFGVVGLIGYVVDFAIFNALSLGAFGAGFWSEPIGATIVSVSVAIVITWVGNRYWTFREFRRKNVVVEFVEFLVVALIGMGISVLCVWISHYVLGFTSLVADNVAKNVVGLAIATTFRFLMYRFWVFGPQRDDGLAKRRARELLSNETDVEPA
jgi:putative flippase GtrA